MTSNPTIRIDEIPQIIRRESLDVWVCSYGGCASNLFTQYLQAEHGLNTRTKTWHRSLGHFPAPVHCDIPKIYLYADPVYAFCSLNRRGTGYWDTNQYKLANSEGITPSQDLLLALMISQFKNWTGWNQSDGQRLLVLPTHELFSESGKRLIEDFLGIILTHFPGRKKPRDYTQCRENLSAYIDKYSDQIDFINKFNHRCLGQPDLKTGQTGYPPFPVHHSKGD